MSPIKVEDETLGTKHKKYNQLVKDAIASDDEIDKEFTTDNQDLHNLKNIDIAAHNKNIKYIINVLKSGDMLYVSRALKQSPWLVDNEYADIINVKYLQETLFPQLTTKTSIKLMKFIKTYIKDETRAEEFYKNETDAKAATKWLTKCSLPFIEANIVKHVAYIELIDFVRLCKMSTIVFEKAFDDGYVGHVGRKTTINKIQSTIFLLDTDTDKYLKAVEGIPMFMSLKFNARATNLIMKKAYDRVMKKLTKYLAILDIPTFVKYIKAEEIKDFLYKLANEDAFFVQNRSVLFRFDIMKYFIMKMPKDQQFEFVKELFIDNNIREIDLRTLTPGTVMYANKRICEAMVYNTPSYIWYKFAPFEIAFAEIKKLMQTEKSIQIKYRMFKTLIQIAGDNMENLQIILKYYNNQHIKDEFLHKQEFVSSLLNETKINKYDDKTWQGVDTILTIMDMYKESKNESKDAIQVILLYNIVNDKPVPEIIEKKFSYSSLKQFKRKLNKEEREKIFTFLYNNLKLKIENHIIKNEETFEEAVNLVNNLLDLLNDWDKSLPDYPFAVDKIKDLIKNKDENSRKKDLQGLYNKNKKWRKYMFEESIILYPTQDACINSLKHEPALLKRYRNQVEKLRYDEKVSLKQFLKKLRIYWGEDLAEEWVQSYFEHIDKTGCQTEVIRGLCILLPKDTLSEVITKYAPETPKIDWNKIDEITLGLQRAIAKNMHSARPQPSPDAVLMYARGDYLQYTIPSLLAIFYNLSRNNSQEYIPKLLDAPVSLRKHGLRFAFLKFDQNVLEQHLSKTWNESKNISIRAVIFQLVFDLICKEKDSEKVENLWKLLDIFMENLTFKEDVKIYQLLHLVDKVPLNIRAAFLMKSYKFLKKLQAETKSDEYSYKLDMMKNYTREIMKLMDPTFVEEIIQEFIEDKLFKYEGRSLGSVSGHSGIVLVITSYVLTAEKEETQRERYDKIIAPLIKRSLKLWDETDKGDYFMRRHFFQILIRFCRDLKDYVHENKMMIPTKIFQSISDELQSLPISENYLILTMWKLTLKTAELIEKHNNNDWDTMSSEISPQLGKICLEYLKEDVKAYFPAIYILFTKAMNIAFGDIFRDRVKLHLYEELLADQEFHEAYMAAIKLIPGYPDRDVEDKVANLKSVIEQHPSVEVKMHYYDRFKESDKVK